MKWRPRNFGESLLPLTTIRAIIGRGVFRYPPGRRHPKFSFIYAIVVTLSFYVAVAYTLKFCHNSSWYYRLPKVFFWIIYTNTAIAALAQILGWYHLKRGSSFMKKITNIDETLEELGAIFDHPGTLKYITAVLIGWLITIGTLNTIDVLWLVGAIPLEQCVFIITILYYPIHINSIIVLNFSIVVRLIGARFHSANEILEKFVKPARQHVNNQAWQYLENKRIATISISTRQILQDFTYRRSVIQIIRQIHLELCCAAKEVDKVFGIQVALEIAAYFVLITFILYDFYLVAMNPLEPKRLWRIVAQIVWGVAYATRLLLVNQACEAVSAEAHRTGDIIHLMDEIRIDPGLSNEVQQFSLQMKQNPLFFSPAGLVILGWKFVLGFIGTVTTYTVILIQSNGVEKAAKIHKYSS